MWATSTTITNLGVCALIAPYAGLVYSGPVVAHAYRMLAGQTFDVVVLVGPSHFVGFAVVSVLIQGAQLSTFEADLFSEDDEVS